MCEECGWEELVADIDETIDDPDYEFAYDTLEGIREWVVDNNHCTESQKEAVMNIMDCKKD
ncbi:MAG: hypothetical protein ACTSUP_07855 [Candidatus Heimdallarchaeaceae archaeon]